MKLSFTKNSSVAGASKIFLMLGMFLLSKNIWADIERFDENIRKIRKDLHESFRFAKPTDLSKAKEWHCIDRDARTGFNTVENETLKVESFKHQLVKMESKKLGQLNWSEHSHYLWSSYEDRWQFEAVYLIDRNGNLVIEVSTVFPYVGNVTFVDSDTNAMELELFEWDKSVWSDIRYVSAYLFCLPKVQEQRPRKKSASMIYHPRYLRLKPANE
jgi:hypothetical protein